MRHVGVLVRCRSIVEMFGPRARSSSQPVLGRPCHRWHVMLRGESPRDPFTVLYTRLHRRQLPRFLVYDNACKLQAYAMRREPVYFADVRFLVDR
jgi:hypothetical protein